MTHHHPVPLDEILDVDGGGQLDVLGDLGIITGQQGQQQHRVVLVAFDLTQKLLGCEVKILGKGHDGRDRKAL